MSDTFEFAVNGKTYNTKKMTPSLRGTISKLTGFLRREVSELDFSKIKTEADVPDWAQMVMSGALMERVPQVMWNFLHSQDKTSIGTFEDFESALTEEIISGFYQWAQGLIKEVHEEVKKTSETEPQPLPSIS